MDEKEKLQRASPATWRKGLGWVVVPSLLLPMVGLSFVFFGDPKSAPFRRWLGVDGWMFWASVFFVLLTHAAMIAVLCAEKKASPGSGQ